jgi:phenylacetate-coenzyme A ligase PaaK-like adenylate-forming protein
MSSGSSASSTASVSEADLSAARARLDSWVKEVVAWHFDPATGSPFWLDYASRLGWDPRTEIRGFADLRRLGSFQDEWLRGGPVERWVPKGLAGKPVFVFETGGTTGIPKTRVACEDFRTDYEIFSETLPDEHFPRGSNWLMLGPSGPRRLRLSVEHLAQHRGGIAFCVDLDPRWVIKLIKKGWTEHLQAYKDHVIDQAVTILQANHDIRCMFTTPKLLESLALRLESMGTSIRKMGITGIFSGGTEFTPQWNRFAHEELLDGAYMTPTYGNTLMGLAASAPSGPHNHYTIAYYAPQPRAVVEVVDFDDENTVVGYGETGRVKLTTLTKEFFVPGFLERDEGEREMPYAKYPWDGVSGVRPYRAFAATTTIGVY